MGLTERQASALNFIRDYMHGDGVAPTFEEIKRALNLKAKSNVHAILKQLKHRGYIDWEYGRARSISVLDFRDSLQSRTANELRAIIAQAAGLAAHKDGDGGAHTAVAMRNIIDRLAGAPRRAAA